MSANRLQSRVYDELSALAVECDWPGLRLPQIRQLVAERVVQAVGDTSTVTGEAYDGELDMARHLIRTLRLAARQGDLAAVQQALVNHAVDDANARDEAKKHATNFFRPGRTYTDGTGYSAPEITTYFRVEHVARHPDREHLRAIGWSRTGEPGACWHGDFRDEGEFEGWTDVTEGDRS